MFDYPKPDLRCSIAASRDEDGTYPILDGGTVVFINRALGGMVTPVIWLHFTVENAGLEGAENFQVKMFVVNHNAIILNPPVETLSLPSGIMVGPVKKGGGPEKTYSFKISGRFGHDNRIRAFMFVDILDSVPEEREWNNFCSFECRVLVVPGKSGN